MCQISAQIDNFDFLEQIFPKKVFSFKKRKSEHHHGILNIPISLITKFQLKLTILKYFLAKINSTTVFDHFEGVKNLVILNILKEKLVISGHFHMKITASVAKSSRQDYGTDLFFPYIHSLLLLENK